MKTVFPNIELFHVHIPKTAGTSLNAMFEGAFGSKFCNHEPKRLTADPAIRMAAAHVTLRSALRQFPNARLITVLRDPESRLKSTLRHLYARRNWSAYSGVGPLVGALIDDKGQFRSSPDLIGRAEFRERFDNLLVRYLTPDPVPEAIMANHVHSALNAIGMFSHVLYQDQFAQDVDTLFDDLGFPGTQEIEKNRAKSSIPLWDELPQEIEPFLTHDKALYQALLHHRDMRAADGPKAQMD